MWRDHIRQTRSAPNSNPRYRTDYTKAGYLEGEKVSAGGAIGLGYKWNLGENFLLAMDFLSLLYRPTIVLKPKITYDEGTTEGQKKTADRYAEESINRDRFRLAPGEFKVGIMW